MDNAVNAGWSGAISMRMKEDWYCGALAGSFATAIVSTSNAGTTNRNGFSTSGPPLVKSFLDNR
jgi:hypothetical protein